MITIDSVLSKKNVNRALVHLNSKDKGVHSSEKRETEISEFWASNGERVSEMIRKKTYMPGSVTMFEIVNGKGRKRVVSRLNEADQLINRLLAQKLNDFFNPMFLPQSHAYQPDKGVLTASNMARDYIEAGCEIVAEIDIESYFDRIPIDRLLRLLRDHIRDEAVLTLLERYLYCTVTRDGVAEKKTIGIIQGMSISPVLSNLYLHSLDQYISGKGYRWLRFADNINIYVSDHEAGIHALEDVTTRLKDEYDLTINSQKSGVYDVFERRLLGYDFVKKGGKVLVKMHQYATQTHYHEWHPCVVEKVNREYYIVKNGVLNKKDFALLFENKEEKHHIPIETTEQLNLYNEVVLPSTVLATLSRSMIRLALYDQYGNLLGYFTPEGYSPDTKTVLAQCSEYNNATKRISMARNMEISALHNIRANIRYHIKRGKDLGKAETVLTEGIRQIKESKTVDEMLLIEARCRQKYYECFNVILRNAEFRFTTRSKQPPRDEINALVSFGNTLLYNRILQIIWKTSLDPRIGCFHAANRRHHSLNLDFADVFKPIISDRVIFALINRGQLRKDDFIHHDDGSVYLNDAGKKTFIAAFEGKMAERITVKDETFSYHRLLEKEIYAYLRHLMEGAAYKPFKYY